jgi:DNA-binding CsgD family transcriptional regulator
MATSEAAPHDAARWELFAHWHRLIDAGDPRFRKFSTVEDVAAPLAELAASLRVSHWNMQRHWTIASIRSALADDERLHRQGVTTRMILPRRVAERRCPLASSYEPELRLAPVPHPLLIGDGRLVVVGDSTGDAVWASSAPDVVERAVDLFEQVWQAAACAVPEDDDPPYTPRMVEIALLLVDGATDREIARALGVSERTVSADVGEMSRRLGARSRAHAIALISGGDS